MILRALPVLAASLSAPAPLAPAAPASAPSVRRAPAAPAIAAPIPAATLRAPLALSAASAAEPPEESAPAPRVGPAEAALKVLDLVDSFGGAVQLLRLEEGPVVSVRFPSSRLRILAEGAGAAPAQMDGYPVRYRLWKDGGAPGPR